MHQVPFALTLTLTFTLALSAPSARAEIWVVPDDAPTISAAIMQAADLDEIVVQPGVYQESITVNKDLVVRSAEGPGSTTLIGDGTQPVVSIQGGLAAVTLEGFTITGGGGVTGAGVTVILWGTAASEVVLRGNVITDNVATSANPAVSANGGGVFSVGATYLELTDNVISSNSAVGGLGGGLYFPPTGDELVLQGNTFEDNDAEHGGAVYATSEAAFTASNNHFRGNEACQGGGLFLRCQPTSPTRNNCDPTILDRNTFFANVASCPSSWNGAGGAIALDAPGLNQTVTILRSTFVGNLASDAASAILAGETGSLSLDVDSSILWANWVYSGGLDQTQIGTLDPVNTPVLNVTYSTMGDLSVYGTLSPMTVTDTTGTIAADPMLVNQITGDLALLPTSPCIDAGNPTAPLDPDGTVIDMGAVPYDAGAFFLRGDTNRDGTVNVGDIMPLLDSLFVAGAPPLTCDDAADVNDDGSVNMGDAIYLLAALFTPNTPPIPAPGTAIPGPDPTDDALGCGP